MVTVVANRRRKSMSCSTTTTVRVLAISCRSSAVRPAEPCGEVDVLDHRELLEDGRRLERPAHAEAHDLEGAQADQLLAREPDRAGGCAGEGRYRVDQRRLARPVGADEEPELPL